jgi:hypothetical protein
MGSCGLDSSESELGSVVGTCEYGYGPSGSTKGGVFLDQSYQLLKNDTAPWSEIVTEGINSVLLL